MPRQSDNRPVLTFVAVTPVTTGAQGVSAVGRRATAAILGQVLMAGSVVGTGTTSGKWGSIWRWAFRRASAWASHCHSRNRCRTSPAARSASGPVGVHRWPVTAGLEADNLLHHEPHGQEKRTALHALCRIVQIRLIRIGRTGGTTRVRVSMKRGRAESGA